MDLQDVWIPYVTTHVVAFLLILICYKWPKIGKVAWGIIFIFAGIFNTNPNSVSGYNEVEAALQITYIDIQQF